ncbi:M23 family metallopeptidase [Protaetiibacter larvae]|uniref:M23 family metallopeptidase n=1 Tax=Protaetiibacter larvae TaxID=2592654 RepID=A0A5C1Y5V7_9MICO|nr:M23 family metallopeptidase [Protaetiibacter larvae]QEO08788.1 M23 family metallopeptidase [Protaetiibacter larvae]
MNHVAPVARTRRERRDDERRRVVTGRSGTRRAVGSRVLSFGVLAVVGAFLVGVSVPATALGVITPADAAGTAPALAAAVTEPGQEVDVHGDLAESVEARDGFEVKSWAEVLREKYGPRNYSYTVGSGAIRWPFPYAVPISSGYGQRVAACNGCSTDHKGIDFVPGLGAPIYAIADGVVVEHEENHWSFGNTVVLQHQIDGQVVETRYAHMQLSSSPLQLGDTVAVGDFIGLVGQTGVATAPHLHFEVIVEGAHVDPFVWLTEHAS